MLFNIPDEGLYINNQLYCVGSPVIGKNCEYEGLLGIINEIRTDDDKETENEGVDIYCEFYKPTDPKHIAQVEATFSALYQTPKTIDDIILDFVIMAPEMLDVKGYLWR